ncbi:MAG: hypothetical protein U0231_16405 [Nitrospiraceae bacterium]
MIARYLDTKQNRRQYGLCDRKNSEALLKDHKSRPVDLAGLKVLDGEAGFVSGSHR